MNDRERELWVLNDEGLYTWFQQTKSGMRRFLRENRAEIDRAIRVRSGPKGATTP